MGITSVESRAGDALERRLKANYAAVRDRIATACKIAGRDSSEVELLAVTKKVPPAIAAALVGLGQTSLAESRTPELERKTASLADQGHRPHWHFIGSLQRNKVRRVVQLAHTLHSIDSIRLLESVERVAGELNARPNLYLQVISHT